MNRQGRAGISGTPTGSSSGRAVGTAFRYMAAAAVTDARHEITGQETVGTAG